MNIKIIKNNKFILNSNNYFKTNNQFHIIVDFVEIV